MDTKVKKLLLIAAIIVAAIFFSRTSGCSPSLKIAIVANDGFTLGDNSSIKEISKATLANRVLATLVYPSITEYWIDEKVAQSDLGIYEYRRASVVNPKPYIIKIDNSFIDNSKVYLNYIPLVKDRYLDENKIAASFNSSVYSLLFSKYEYFTGKDKVTLECNAGPNKNQLSFEGSEVTEKEVYTLLSISRTLNNTTLLNYGLYRIVGKLRSGSNTVRLRLKPQTDSTRPELGDSLPPEIKIEIRTDIRNEKELGKYAVIIHPGYPEDILGGNFPESYVPYVIPYGYTYIAVVRNKELDPHAVYSVLKRYAENYLLEKVGLDNSIADRFIEKWWIPHSWLMLGRATNIRTAIYDDSFSYYPTENSLFFTVGVYTGSGTQVQPINFQNFHGLFFEGNPKVFAVQSIKDITSKDPDVVIYKATFDPNFDSPGIIYDFAKGVMPGVELWRDIKLFNMSMLLYDPSDREVVDRARTIQSYLNNYYMVAFPIFSEPITVIIDTTRVRNFALNYRHILSGFYDWKWEAQK